MELSCPCENNWYMFLLQKHSTIYTFVDSFLLNCSLSVKTIFSVVIVGKQTNAEDLTHTFHLFNRQLSVTGHCSNSIQLQYPLWFETKILPLLVSSIHPAKRNPHPQTISEGHCHNKCEP